MKFKSKKWMFLLVYVLLVSALYLASATLTKYSSGETVNATFNIGGNLYFKYQRGDLYRNDNRIDGIEVEEEIKDETGNKVDTKRRIETMNVIPGDSLKYRFFVSNYNLSSSPLEANTIDGSFYITAYAEFTMPAHQTNYKLSCTLAYREVTTNGEPKPFTNFTSDLQLDLPIYDEDDPTTHKNYEFEIFVILDEQIETTSADDYIDSTLSILLFIDAANDVAAA